MDLINFIYLFFNRVPPYAGHTGLIFVNVEQMYYLDCLLSVILKNIKVRIISKNTRILKIGMCVEIQSVSLTSVKLFTGESLQVNAKKLRKLNLQIMRFIENLHNSRKGLTLDWVPILLLPMPYKSVSDCRI